MIFALLPVKDPARSKERLAGLLTGAERERLAWLLYERTLAVLLGTPEIDRVVAASSNEAVLERARAAGAMAIAERAEGGHSQSADRGARICGEYGATTVVMAPIDVPLAREEDFAAVCRAAPAPHLVIVPSRDGAGTNALAQTPPGVIESCFGPGSLAAHVVQAREKGVPFEILRPPGLVFDLDTPDDVLFYLEHAPAGPIAGLLAGAVSRERRRGHGAD